MKNINLARSDPDEEESVILDNLAEGESYESIMSGYHVTSQDIQAAIAYADDLAEERHIPLEHPGSRGFSKFSGKERA